MDALLSNPLMLLINFGALVVAITIHEFSHAITADRLGDPTPRLQGRLTLNPLAHLDPLGTIMLLIARFGWGKPVQFDPFNLQNPRRDAALISFAGPLSNILTATIASLLMRLLIPLQFSVFAHTTMVLAVGFTYLLAFLQIFIVLSIFLAIFNLVPVHPLDGFKIVGGFLSKEKAREWYSLERYGIILLLLLVFPIFSSQAPISRLIIPIVETILKFLLPQGGFA